MSKKLLVSLTAVGVLVFVSAGKAQIPEDPIRWALTLPAPNTTTTPGGAITLSLTATIDDGWHLYATTIGPGGPIPTAISVPAGQAFTLTGDINEPTPKSAFDPNFNKVLEFHEDKATFGIPLKVSASSGYGELPARVAVSFQACNDRFCLPPKQVVSTVQVKVMPSAVQRAEPVPPIGEGGGPQAALVENNASYSGENGLRIQPMIVRDMMGQENDRGMLLGKSAPERITWDVDLSKLEAANLSVVVFLQDDVTHEVLQSAFVPIK